MSLKHAILGFLSLEDMSGYTLKTQYFDGSVAHFWPADQAQIYRTLEQIERDGLAVSRQVPGETRPARRVYSLTDAGLAELKSWLSRQHPPSPNRVTLLVQVYFARHIPTQTFRALLEAERLRQSAMLDTIETIDLSPENAPNELLRQQYKFGRLTKDYGLRRIKMEIEWISAMIDELDD